MSLFDDPFADTRQAPSFTDQPLFADEPDTRQTLDRRDRRDRDPHHRATQAVGFDSFTDFAAEVEQAHTELEQARRRARDTRRVRDEFYDKDLAGFVEESGVHHLFGIPASEDAATKVRAVAEGFEAEAGRELPEGLLGGIRREDFDRKRRAIANSREFQLRRERFDRLNDLYQREEEQSERLAMRYADLRERQLSIPDDVREAMKLREADREERREMAHAAVVTPEGEQLFQAVGHEPSDARVQRYVRKFVRDRGLANTPEQMLDSVDAVNEVLTNRMLRERLSERGMIMSEAGRFNDRPLGLQRRERTLLHLEDARRAGVRHFQNQPIDHLIEQHGGRPAVEKAQLMESFFEANRMRSVAHLDLYRLAAAGEPEAFMEAFEDWKVANDLMAFKANDLGSEGLLDEAIERVDNVGAFRAIVNAFKRGNINRQMSRLLPQIQDETATADDIAFLVALAGQSETFGSSEQYERLMTEVNSENLLEGFEALARHPLAALEMAAESLTAFLPAIMRNMVRDVPVGAATGLATGAVLGKGIFATFTAPVGAAWGARAGVGVATARATYALEGIGVVLETLSGEGVDINNPAAFYAALQDPEMMDDIRGRINRRGIPPAVFYGLSSMFGGMFLRGIGRPIKVAGHGRSVGGQQYRRIRGTLARADDAAARGQRAKARFYQLAGPTAEITMQGLAGGLGSGVGQYMLDPNEPIDWTEVAAEFALEWVGPGLPGNAAVLYQASRDSRQNQLRALGKARENVTDPGDKAMEYFNGLKERSTTDMQVVQEPVPVSRGGDGQTGQLAYRGGQYQFQQFASAEDAVVGLMRALGLSPRSASARFLQRFVPVLAAADTQAFSTLKFVFTSDPPHQTQIGHRDGTQPGLYDPTNNVLFINPEVAETSQLGVASVFLHETGHFAERFVGEERLMQLYRDAVKPKKPAPAAEAPAAEAPTTPEAPVAPELTPLQEIQQERSATEIQAGAEYVSQGRTNLVDALNPAEKQHLVHYFADLTDQQRASEWFAMQWGRFIARQYDQVDSGLLPSLRRFFGRQKSAIRRFTGSEELGGAVDQEINRLLAEGARKRLEHVETTGNMGQGVERGFEEAARMSGFSETETNQAVGQMRQRTLAELIDAELVAPEPTFAERQARRADAEAGLTASREAQVEIMWNRLLEEQQAEQQAALEAAEADQVVAAQQEARLAAETQEAAQVVAAQQTLQRFTEPGSLQPPGSPLDLGGAMQRAEAFLEAPDAAAVQTPRAIRRRANERAKTRISAEELTALADEIDDQFSAVVDLDAPGITEEMRLSAVDALGQRQRTVTRALELVQTAQDDLATRRGAGEEIAQQRARERAARAERQQQQRLHRDRLRTAVRVEREQERMRREAAPRSEAEATEFADMRRQAAEEGVVFTALENGQTRHFRLMAQEDGTQAWVRVNKRTGEPYQRKADSIDAETRTALDAHLVRDIRRTRPAREAQRLAQEEARAVREANTQPEIEATIRRVVSQDEFDSMADRLGFRGARTPAADPTVTPTFTIVPQRGPHDVTGMRARGGLAHMNNTMPGRPGWLGNPYRWEGNRGPKGVTVEQAVARFREAFLKKVESDEAFRREVLALRGKRVGYYRPDTQTNHLKVVQDWLAAQAEPAAAEPSVVDPGPEPTPRRINTIQDVFDLLIDLRNTAVGIPTAEVPGRMAEIRQRYSRELANFQERHEMVEVDGERQFRSLEDQFSEQVQRQFEAPYRQAVDRVTAQAAEEAGTDAAALLSDMSDPQSALRQRLRGDSEIQQLETRYRLARAAYRGRLNEKIGIFQRRKQELAPFINDLQRIRAEAAVNGFEALSFLDELIRRLEAGQEVAQAVATPEEMAAAARVRLATPDATVPTQVRGLADFFSRSPEVADAYLSKVRELRASTNRMVEGVRHAMLEPVRREMSSLYESRNMRYDELRAQTEAISTPYDTAIDSLQAAIEEFAEQREGREGPFWENTLNSIDDSVTSLQETLATVQEAANAWKQDEHRALRQILDETSEAARPDTTDIRSEIRLLQDQHREVRQEIAALGAGATVPARLRAERIRLSALLDVNERILETATEQERMKDELDSGITRTETDRAAELSREPDFGERVAQEQATTERLSNNARVLQRLSQQADWATVPDTMADYFVRYMADPPAVEEASPTAVARGPEAADISALDLAATAITLHNDPVADRTARLYVEGPGPVAEFLRSNVIPLERRFGKLTARLAAVQSAIADAEAGAEAFGTRLAEFVGDTDAAGAHLRVLRGEEAQLRNDLRRLSGEFREMVGEFENPDLLATEDRQPGQLEQLVTGRPDVTLNAMDRAALGGMMRKVMDRYDEIITRLQQEGRRTPAKQAQAHLFNTVAATSVFHNFTQGSRKTPFNPQAVQADPALEAQLYPEGSVGRDITIGRSRGRSFMRDRGGELDAQRARRLVPVTKSPEFTGVVAERAKQFARRLASKEVGLLPSDQSYSILSRNEATGKMQLVAVETAREAADVSAERPRQKVDDAYADINYLAHIIEETSGRMDTRDYYAMVAERDAIQQAFAQERLDATRRGEPTPEGLARSSMEALQSVLGKFHQQENQHRFDALTQTLQPEIISWVERFDSTVDYADAIAAVRGYGAKAHPAWSALIDNLFARWMARDRAGFMEFAASERGVVALQEAVGARDYLRRQGELQQVGFKGARIAYADLEYMRASEHLRRSAPRQTNLRKMLEHFFSPRAQAYMENAAQSDYLNGNVTELEYGNMVRTMEAHYRVARFLLDSEALAGYLDYVQAHVSDETIMRVRGKLIGGVYAHRQGVEPLIAITERPYGIHKAEARATIIHEALHAGTVSILNRAERPILDAAAAAGEPPPVGPALVQEIFNAADTDPAVREVARTYLEAHKALSPNEQMLLRAQQFKALQLSEYNAAVAEGVITPSMGSFSRLYAMSNLQEFVAASVTSRAFREWLGTLPRPAGRETTSSTFAALIGAEHNTLEVRAINAAMDLVPSDSPVEGGRFLGAVNTITNTTQLQLPSVTRTFLDQYDYSITRGSRLQALQDAVSAGSQVFWEKFQVLVADKAFYWGKLMREVAARKNLQPHEIPTAINTHLMMENYPGVAGEGMLNFYAFRQAPMERKMAQHNVSQSTLGKYAVSRFAATRNESIRKAVLRLAREEAEARSFTEEQQRRIEAAGDREAEVTSAIREEIAQEIAGDRERFPEYGSGVSVERAAQLRQEAIREAGNEAVLQDLFNDMRNINIDGLMMLWDAGLLPRDEVMNIIRAGMDVNVEGAVDSVTFNEQTSRIEFDRRNFVYVPLIGTPENTGAGRPHVRSILDQETTVATQYGYRQLGSGFGISDVQQEFALGRWSEPDPNLILQNTYENYRRAIVLDAKSRVDRSIVALVADMLSDPNLREAALKKFEFLSDKQVREVRQRTAKGMEMRRYTPSVDPDLSIIRVHGDRLAALGAQFGPKQAQVLQQAAKGMPEGAVYLRIKDPLLLRAYKNYGVERTGKMLGMARTITSYLARVATTWNPEFLLTNFFRDYGTAIPHLMEPGMEAFGTKAMHPNNVRKSILAARKAERALRRGEAPDTTDPLVKLYMEYRNDGGKTSFFNYETVGDRARRMDSRIRTIRHPTRPASLAKRGFGEFMGIIEEMNTAVENGIRFSTYTQARAAGVDRVRAANLGRNITVNFNRKGELGSAINSLYVFSNAVIQGNMRILQSILKSNKVKGIVGGIVAVSAAHAVAMRMLGGEDDDEVPYYSKVSRFHHDHTITLPLDGNGRIFRFPLPYGYNMFWAVGQRLGEAIHAGMAGESVDPFEMSITLADTILNTVNPVGGSGDLFATLTPTPARPFVELMQNRDFMGRAIYRENAPYSTPLPNSQLHFDSVNPLTRRVFHGLNEVTGGNDLESGWIDVNPAIVDYAIAFAAGGLGRFGQAVTDSGYTIATGGVPTVDDAPVVRRFFSQVGNYYSLQKYNELRQDIMIARRLAERIKDERPEDYERFRVQRENLLKMDERRATTDSALNAIRRRERAIRLNKDLTPEQKSEQLEELRDSRMKHIHRTIREARSLGIL